MAALDPAAGLALPAIDYYLVFGPPAHFFDPGSLSSDRLDFPYSCSVKAVTIPKTSAASSILTVWHHCSNPLAISGTVFPVGTRFAPVPCKGSEDLQIPTKSWSSCNLASHLPVL